MNVTGQAYINGQAVQGNGGSFQAFDPSQRKHIEPAFKAVVAWVDARYEFGGEVPALTGPPMRVLVRRDMAGSERLGDTGLPCPH